MFAFAIWDERTKELFIARDRVGKKPVLYAQVNGQLIFGSEFSPYCSIRTFRKTSTSRRSTNISRSCVCPPADSLSSD